MSTKIQIDDLEFANRPVDGHKGTFGKVAVIGGSLGMSGSITLSATAALRGGAGLVTAAVPQSIQAIVAGYEPSYMTVALPTDVHGQLAAVDADIVTELLDGKSAVAIGPGLGQTKLAADLVLAVLKQADCPVVLDADALNLAAEFELLHGIPRRSRWVITPHPGEFARLTGESISHVSANRESLAERFAAEHELTVVLKGANTVVTDGSRTYVNQTGNSGMATGGSGDILTGLTAAVLGQHADALEGAILAVYVHGIAGDLAAEALSQRGMIASDLLRFLSAAWRNLSHEPSD
ncbi:NAD(P)H-hydrate dehydratase [Fuerstiella marisgermanici]|uniref:ADP-dependent (S)-NAD(P)H-hydrate dehydratase n=1 Tax=Fuerstiella marisgermanici TaxID=1891926 RepID=A0A1P8WBI0_9PLAN|nr:NAD(P)H-hydrate dehydratase [Fuerstiella marisgermanici]APZ91418.1 Nicotinamide nucleotide repair protein [Fuerstiella marisgermanici]